MFFIVTDHQDCFIPLCRSYFTTGMPLHVTARVQAALLRCTAPQDAAHLFFSLLQVVQTSEKPAVPPASLWDSVCSWAEGLYHHLMPPFLQPWLLWTGTDQRKRVYNAGSLSFWLLVSNSIKLCCWVYFIRAFIWQKVHFIFVPDMKQTLQSLYKWNRMPISFL